MRTLALVLFAIVGCRGGKSPGVNDTSTTSTTGTNGGPTGTGDTTTTPSTTQGGEVLDEVRFEATIGWDADSATIVDTSEGPSVYRILLTTTAGTECTVEIALGGVRPSSRVGWLWSLNVPTTGLGGTEDCLAAGVDPAQFDPRDPVEAWVAHGFRLRLGGDLDPALEDWLTPDPPPASFDIQHYVGGDWSTASGVFSGDPEINFWRGFAMSGTTVDRNQPLLRAEMERPDGTLETGLYFFDQTAFWDLR